MFEYVDAVWGWDDDFQARFFDEHFDVSSNRHVIEVSDEGIGTVEIWDEPARLVLASIRVAPEWQGRGVGTAIIRSVLSRGAAERKPVALQVLKVNPRAKQLYEREGFRVVEETPTHFRMEAAPGAESLSPAKKRRVAE